MKKIYILGGGTFSHVRNHFSLAAPAFGETARQLHKLFENGIMVKKLTDRYSAELVLTKMADHTSNLVTNEDVDAYVDTLIADPDTKAIIFNVALCDFEGSVGDVKSGKHAERLKTSEYGGLFAPNGGNMHISPAKKIIGKIRKTRKDIFVVGFKTTTEHSSDDQYIRGLELLKKNSLNLVLANDTVTRNNIIIAPEETRYSETTDRSEVLSFLTKMVLSRMQNHFTRSTVIDKKDFTGKHDVPWASPDVPESLRTVVNHCIEKGAYKPFLGRTAGHFAVKVGEGEILTSARKTNFNHDLQEFGLVRVESQNADEVIAYGRKPSVGGQSQRIIFKEHPDKDCIVHFHCPLKEDSTSIPVASQWQNECGSHECGQNTSDHLGEFDLDGDKISVVYLDGHGPNIVFNKNVPAEKVIAFIDQNFDLSKKTGGLVSAG